MEEFPHSRVFEHSLLKIAAKRAMLRKSIGQITTLALGSSHGDFGFDPEFCPGAFNLCSRSQDLRHSNAIHRRIAPIMPKLRNVVVFYSVFSPGSVLEQSKGELDMCLALHEILDLNLTYSDPYLVAHAGKLRDQYAQYRPEVEGRLGFLPKLQKPFFPESYGAERRAQEHLKLNGRREANLYLVSLLLRAQRLGHQVLVVIPPAREDYRRGCGAPSGVLFRGLAEIRSELEVEAPFGVLDLFADPDFRPEHFGDFDHLLPLGAGTEILSRKVYEALATPS
ncbi:hypothetical protein [Phenylobacterium sp. J367]|uniref:hypothetical protein n=1 Tax=Phenylobacterium sp. J367 TaxID=2898435 RepID=UPI00215190B9|nr:hypothetical protein [Phenylobacterium sp. J367]MCR5877446.1 hypothetical protein [Phenylobacterium sp. J367]